MGKVKIIGRKDVQKGVREVRKREAMVALKFSVSEGEKIALEAAKKARILPGIHSGGGGYIGQDVRGIGERT